jgi:hypothetical protein
MLFRIRHISCEIIMKQNASGSGDRNLTENRELIDDLRVDHRRPMTTFDK